MESKIIVGGVNLVCTVCIFYGGCYFSIPLILLCFSVIISFCYQLEKAKEQELLLEQSAKELSVRQDRERELEKLIAEKEVWPFMF